MKKQFTIFLFLLLFSPSFFITKNVFATCSSPADRGYKQCSESDRYAIDSWYNSQMADLRRRGLTFSGAAVALQNEYQLKISGCEEDNNNYAQALIDYEECLKQVEELKQLCTSYSWSCGDWSTCSANGVKSRTCSKNSTCEGGVQSPDTSQPCTYIPACSADTWQCGDWGACSSQGTQGRSCTRTYDCPSVEKAAPTTTQSCTYTPACTADTWQCDNWSTCSPQGIQTRSCSKTFDCSSAETASPVISQYCEAPNKQVQKTPTEDLAIVNQDLIVKATVKLICPVSSTMAAQGSGTVIDSKGTILTNKHVINGTAGCLVGFIDNYNDEPYFGDRQIADIDKISSDADIAILKLRNPNNRNITAIDIAKGNSSNLRLGDEITTYGYPAKFGTKIIYTSGDFSGIDGNYLQTTAIIDSGNSGGGAYLKNGTFIGMPSGVSRGNFNIMGEILSINKINSWLNNSAIAYNSGSGNNYSRVSSILENIDLNTLNSLNLFIAENETGAESQKIIAEEKKSITKIDNSLSRRMKGRILLQVENHGEAWYVNPKDSKKYYMANGDEAYTIMRSSGVGITNKDLEKVKSDKNFAKKHSGKIFLQVEDKGQAYYIDSDGNEHYLKNGEEAYNIMRELGLGITNSDIRKISVGEIK